MRLTLRTMLAYLDDILEPADAQELGRKIDQSDFASSLVHRIRTSMRRLRLGAPPLDGKGMGLDPNTVAEYLDSTLPQDRMPDFEKVCLESDVHLAEIAACHQVLALVLGEPAEIEPALRQRVYELISPQAEIPGHFPVPPVESQHSKPATEARDAVDAPAAGEQVSPAPPPVVAPAASTASMTPAADSTAAEGAAVPPPAPGALSPARREVPDYLRKRSAIPLWPVLATVLVAFLLAVGALRAVGPFDRHHPVLGFFGGPAEVAKKDEEPVVAVDDADPVAVQDESHSRETAPVDEVEPAPPEARRTAPVETERGDAAGRSSPNEPLDTARPVGDALPDLPLPPFPGTVTDTAAEAADAPAPPAVAEGSGESTAAGGPAEQGEETSSGLGRYVSEDQVLVRYDEGSDFWLRLPPRAVLRGSDELLVLPTYRPQVLLTSGVQLMFAGQTSARLEHPDDAGIARLTVPFGRLLVVTVGRPDARLHLNLAGREGILGFSDAESVAAVEVRHWRVPGTDPETVPAVPVVRLQATSGVVEWEPRGEAAIPIQAGQTYVWVGSDPPRLVPDEEIPAWVDGQDVSSLERMAAQEVQPALSGERPITLSLQELTGHRRSEVRHLAARSLAYLDEFEPMIEALDDPVHKIAWPAYYDAFRQALARGPQTAELVRSELERLRGEDAEVLYRLLWGYSPEQLRSGAAESLVDFLDHPDMDVRVLAFQNLLRITGMTQLYFPEQSEEGRRRAIHAWRQRLQAGEIVYKTPPTPL